MKKLGRRLTLGGRGLFSGINTGEHDPRYIRAYSCKLLSILTFVSIAIIGHIFIEDVVNTMQNFTITQDAGIMTRMKKITARTCLDFYLSAQLSPVYLHFKQAKTCLWLHWSPNSAGFLLPAFILHSHFGIPATNWRLHFFAAQLHRKLHKFCNILLQLNSFIIPTFIITFINVSSISNCSVEV